MELACGNTLEEGGGSSIDTLGSSWVWDPGLNSGEMFGMVKDATVA